MQHDYVRRLLAARYDSVPLPDVVRARVYLHHSRVASTFRVGAVLLAGDAAHLQPPFFGQGMNSGLRDAMNLSWKLAAVVRGVAGPELVATYDSERRPHATVMVHFATKIGSMYRPHNAITERLRDLVFRAVQRVPSARDYVLQMKYKPMPRYVDGVVAGVNPKDKHDPIGRMFPQPDVEVHARRMRLDDAIGPWFAVLCLRGDPLTLDHEALAWWRSVGVQLVEVNQVHGDVRSQRSDGEVAALDDVAGAFDDWRRAHPGADVIVLRPDRYVAAACARSDFATTTAALRSVFGCLSGVG